MKLATDAPWMSAAEYGRSLRGLTLNLLVREIEAALRFQREVLGAEVIYSDLDFAALRHGNAEWMLHADHTYESHPLYDRLRNETSRGTGAELRLHNCDPDAAQSAALRLGYAVLSPAKNMPHGVREAFLVDADGYIWVPDVALAG